jgi:signal transduction histidine kinase
MRIAMLFSATFVVGLTAILVITYFQIQSSLEKSNREVLSAKLSETSAILSAEGLPGLRRFLSQEENRLVNAAFMIRLVSESGQTLYLKPSVQDKNFDFQDLFHSARPVDFVGWRALSAIHDEDQFDVLTAPVVGGSYLQIGKSSEDRNDILEQIVNVLLVTGAVIFLLSVALGQWYARRALAPIRRLLITMRDIEGGDLSRRVPLAAHKDELTDLGETFNRVIARLEKLVRMMRESLDNVAHDIRTPLTRIRAVAEDALTAKSPDRIREALEDCAESSLDISALVDQLMSISEAEAGTLSLRIEATPVQELLQDVIEIYEFVAEEKRIKLVVSQIKTELIWNLDRKRVKQALANLIDNAIKFSAPETKIEISAKLENKKLVILVRDQGPGISQTELSRIWDRLYRGDKSRSTRGLGLGLSIVRAVALAHGGSVDAAANLEAGMVFSILLPEA